MPVPHQPPTPAPAATDELAMRRVQADGDPEAFAQLVRRWERPIRNLCLRMTSDLQASTTPWPLAAKPPSP